MTSATLSFVPALPIITRALGDEHILHVLLKRGLCVKGHNTASLFPDFLRKRPLKISVAIFLAHSSWFPEEWMTKLIAASWEKKWNASFVKEKDFQMSVT